MFRLEVATAKPSPSCVAWSTLPGASWRVLGPARAAERVEELVAPRLLGRPRLDRLARVDEHRHLVDAAVRGPVTRWTMNGTVLPASVVVCWIDAAGGGLAGS